MIFKNERIIIIYLFILLQISFNQNISLNLNETLNLTFFESLNSSNISEYEEIKCDNFTDCLNCTLHVKCQWNWVNETCENYTNFNQNFTNFTIPDLPPKSKNLDLLNKHINFLRKACFKSVIPFVKNSYSIYRDNNTIDYCGNNFIFNTITNIQLPKINGNYGVKNLLCEYMIFSGEHDYHVKIKIDQYISNHFYLLFSNTSDNFSRIIQDGDIIDIKRVGNLANTFIYYGQKMFSSPPFQIMYEKDLKVIITTKATEYIMVAFIAIVLILIILGTIYIRKNSILFKKENEDYNYEEHEKMNKDNGDNRDNTDNEENTNNKENEDNKEKKNNKKNKIIEIKVLQSPDNLQNFSPISLLPHEHFSYRNICCVDNNFIQDKDLFKATCGDFYHYECFQKLIEEGKKKQKKSENEKIEINCVSCGSIIYP